LSAQEIDREKIPLLMRKSIKSMDLMNAINQLKPDTPEFWIFRVVGVAGYANTRGSNTAPTATVESILMGDWPSPAHFGYAGDHELGAAMRTH
jgi:hypothetical protein